MLVHVRVFAKAEGLIEAHKICVYKKAKKYKYMLYDKKKENQQQA